MRKLEQFPSSQGAVAHSTTKPVLHKSAEHPNLEPAVAPNDVSSVTSQSKVKSSMPKLEHTQHIRKQIQIPTPNNQQNETKQIITDYLCFNCGAKFSDKNKVYEHSLKVHKIKIVFPEDLVVPSQLSQPNKMHTACEKRARKREESALFIGLSKIVKLPGKSKADIMIRAKEQIEKLTEVSSELQRQLHMEMSRNQQLKNELERCQQPPIKLKIQHGKSVLPDDD